MRFQWLKDFQELDEQILYLKWNLNKSSLELNRWVYGDLSNVRLERNSRSSSLEENIQKLEEEIERLEEQKNEMVIMVESFKGIDNQIIRLKYVEGVALEDVADIIGYSVSYVRKRHTEIRRTLQFIDEYEERRDDRSRKQGEIDYHCEKKNQISLF